MRKQLLSTLLVLCMLLALLPGTAFATDADSEPVVQADTSYPHGSCGENLTWEFHNGLHIRGTGRMNDYFAVGRPWDVALQNASNLRIYVEEGVTYIGNSAFIDIFPAISAYFPSTLEEIGEYAFAYCKSLGMGTVSFPQDGNLTTIGHSAFYDCYGLTSISLPNKLTTIGFDAFRHCRNLRSVTIPSTVTYLGYNAFNDCASLTSVVIPGSVTTILTGTFDGCSSLYSVEIKEGVTSIEDFAFSVGVNAITGKGTSCSITIPKSVTSIGDEAFCSVIPSLGYIQTITIRCYSDSYAHQYAESHGFPYVLLDAGSGSDPDSDPDPSPDPSPTPTPEITIQSVTMMRNDGQVDLLTQPAEFEQGSTEAVDVSAAVDWNGGETGRVFLIQSRDKYVELPAAIAPATAFDPDTPIYAIATNADADELLDWKLTKLQVVEPASDDLTVSLSLWNDANYTNEITSMTDTYGSFSWTQTGSSFDTAYLKLEYTGADAATLTLTAPEGFSFVPDTMETTWTASVSQAFGTEICPIYPIYSENYQKGGTLEFTAEISSPDPGGDSAAQDTLTVPVLENQAAGGVYYRDSFTEKQTGPVPLKDFSMEGFTKASTLYDQNLAMLSACLSAAVYNRDGVERTLQNFGFSKSRPSTMIPSMTR